MQPFFPIQQFKLVSITTYYRSNVLQFFSYIHIAKGKFYIAEGDFLYCIREHFLIAEGYFLYSRRLFLYSRKGFFI